MLAQIPRKSRYTRYVAKHPLRRNAPVTLRCTRYVALHPIRRGAMPTDRVHRPPQQAQPRAIRPHRPQPSTSDAVIQLRHARPVPNERRCTRYVAAHPLRRATPVTSQCTRSEGVQCLRIGCTAPPQQAKPRTIRPHRPQPSTSDAVIQLRHARPVPNERRCTRYVAAHPLRRATPVTSQCTRSEGVQCLRIGCTASHNKHNRENVPSRKKPRRLPLGNRRGPALTIQLSRSR